MPRNAETTSLRVATRFVEQPPRRVCCTSLEPGLLSAPASYMLAE